MAGRDARADGPVPVIFDTDMDSDVDDVAALCQLHAEADRGGVDLLAVMISGHNEWSGPCSDAINTFYGRPDLPIGLAAEGRGIRQESKYARPVAEAFPQDFGKGQQKQDAVKLYRELLAGQPDGSVVVVTVGDLTNLAGLLSSGPDQASPLAGRELVASKVRDYVCMGSRYPADMDPGAGKWGNFRTDPVSAQEVVKNWPGRLTFTGGGPFADSMAIGKKLAELDPGLWPVSLAYRSYFGGTGKTRHAADSIAVWVAVRGTDPWFQVVEEGYNEIDDIGRNIWHETPDAPNQRYTSALKDPSSAPSLAAMMEEWAMTPPKAGLPAGK
jgi:hypothetical protein